MFDSPENWIPMGEKYRIALYRQETESENPLEQYYDMTSCWTVNQARGYNGIFSAVDDASEELIRRVTDETESNNYADLQNEIVHALEREFDFLVMPVSLRGYSQGEWMDVILFEERDGGRPEDVQRAAIDRVRHDLECWFRGDVYIIALEELITYTAPNGKTILRWEIVDGVGASWDNYFSEPPAVEDLLDRLDVEPAEYGADIGMMELMR